MIAKGELFSANSAFPIRADAKKEKADLLKRHQLA
jgi:hypothetical protein